MCIGEIHIPVAGQLDRPNDQLPVIDFDPGGRYEGDDDVRNGRHGIPIKGLEHPDDLGKRQRRYVKRETSPVSALAIRRAERSAISGGSFVKNRRITLASTQSRLTASARPAALQDLGPPRSAPPPCRGRGVWPEVPHRGPIG